MMTGIENKNFDPHNSPTDFRLFLQGELVRRCQKNPKFSMRAFARLLAIENSALSKILCGKRALTSKMVLRLGGKLGLGPLEISQFSIIPSSNLPMSIDANYFQLSLDQFTVIADWYHYAVLELVKLKSFKCDPQGVSRKLGVTYAEASGAIDRLLRLGYLERTKNGTLTNKSGPLTTVKNDFTVTAFRRLQTQILEQAIVALEQIPFEKRDQSSMTMAISSAKIKSAREKIKKFRRELCAFLEKDKDKLDEVYHLSISLYPVTKS